MLMECTILMHTKTNMILLKSQAAIATPAAAVPIALCYTYVYMSGMTVCQRYFPVVKANFYVFVVRIFQRRSVLLQPLG